MCKNGLLLRKLLLIFGSFLVIFSSYSQTDENNDPSSSDTLIITFDSIPELQIFIDAALANSPLLTLTDAEIKKIQEEIKLEKNNWQNLITLDANTKYGLYNQLIVNESTGGGDPDASLSNKTQLNYFAGITIKIPISEILGKKSRIKVLQSGIDQAELRRKALKREISAMIVDAYYLFKIKQETYVNFQEEFQAMNLAYLTAKRNVEKGLINIDEYSGIISKKTAAQTALTTSKYDLFAEYNKLLILSGLSKYVK